MFSQKKIPQLTFVIAFLGVMIISFLTTSCQKEQFESIENSDLISSNQLESRSVKRDELDTEVKPIRLIKQLENPYTVEAMEMAQQKLIEKGIIKRSVKIYTTHHYIRFLPSNNLDYEQLVERIEEKEGGELFDYPLDYELSEDGSYFLDPKIGSDSITWFYTVVPANYKFPRIKHETLADLFLFEDDKAENLDVLELIEDESLKLTGNWDKEEELSEQITAGPRGRKWRPKGKINVMDDQLRRIVPIEGAKVVMRRWFKWSKDFTDVNGEFESPKRYRKKVRYKIKWARSSYKIRSGHWMFSPAWTRGPKMKGDWNRDITIELPLFYATVHRGAFDFFYKDPFGLKKPNPWFPVYNRLKISALDKCKVSNAIHAASIIGFADIRVYRKRTNCEIRNTLGIYGLTLHELGHSNQRSHGAAKFGFCSKLVRESWAEAVEFAFVMHKYYPGTITSSSTRHNFLDSIFGSSSSSIRNYPSINWSFSMGNQSYTPIFIDLLDCDAGNTVGTIGFRENVCSYSLRQIELAIANKGWSRKVDNNLDRIQNNLITDFGSRGNLDAYFDVYRNNY